MNDRTYTTDDAMKGLCELEQVGDPTTVWNMNDMLRGWCHPDQVGQIVGEKSRSEKEYLDRCHTAYEAFRDALVADPYDLPRDAETNISLVSESGTYEFNASPHSLPTTVSKAGMYSRYANFLCSPLLVMERIYGDVPMIRTYAQVDGKWVVINIRQDSLNDAGAKLRAERVAVIERRKVRQGKIPDMFPEGGAA